MFRSLVLVSVLLVFVLTSLSQPQPDTLWTRTYDAGMDEIAEAIASAPNDGFYLAGWTGDYSGNQTDAYVLRCNEAGDTLWTRQFGDMIQQSTVLDINPTADGGCVIAGSRGSSEDDYDAVVIRLDSSGNTLWHRTYGGESENGAMAARQLDDGGFIAAGYSIAGNNDMYLLRLTADGDTVWTRRHGDSDNEFATDIAVLPNHDFFISGHNYTYADPFFARVDEAGNLLWMRDYPTFHVDAIYCLAVHEQYLYGAGYRARGNPNRNDFLLMKLTEDGDTVWTRIFGADGIHEVAHAVIATEDGVVLCGYVDDAGGDINMLLVKYNFEGVFQWEREYDLGTEAAANGVIQLADDSFVLAGGNATDNGSFDMRVLKTGPDQPTFAPDPREIPVPQIASLSVYPNPFNPQTTISFALPVAGSAGVAIYDANGRLVQTLPEQTYAAGEHHIVFNAAQLASGAYFVRLHAGNAEQTVKMILMR